MSNGKGWLTLLFVATLFVTTRNGNGAVPLEASGARVTGNPHLQPSSQLATVVGDIANDSGLVGLMHYAQASM